MSPALLLLLALTTAAPDGHLGQNPVYKTLREEGIAVPGKPVALPGPRMADGLSAAEQKEVIEEIGLGRAQYSFERLTRDSQVAPHILFHPRGEVIDGVRVNTADAYFVASGDLDQIAASRNKISPKNADTAWTNLDAEDLDARGIELAHPKHDGYGHISRNVLNKVQVDITIRSYWSRTDDSIIMANVLDPRFADDDEFPNRWRSYVRNASGVLKLSEDAQPYSGVGCYIKITELKEPEGTLFIELHLVYTEPEGWFNGANLLGSKMPWIFRHEVREARGDLDQQRLDRQRGKPKR